MTQLLTSPQTKRAANVLGIVLLIALVVPFAVYAVPEVVGADESFVVLTASMTPAIAPGDVVIVAERDPTTIADGDVITFMRGTSDVPVTHRVIDVTDAGGALAFETMGDANEGPDPGLVPAGNLVGVVTLTIPYIGYVVQFAGTQAGFVTLVLLPFGLLAVTEVWAIVRDRDDSVTPPAAATEPAAAEADGDVPAPDVDASALDADGPTASATSGSAGVSVDAVGGAVAVLAGFAPYAVYVAFELRTAAAIAVAVGASTLLFGAAAVWLPASGVLDRGESVAEPAAPTPADAPEPGDDAPEPGDDAPEPGDDAPEPEDDEARSSETDWETPAVVEGANGEADDRLDETGTAPPTATLAAARSDGVEEGN